MSEATLPVTTPAADTRLDSWKAIASYLSRDVRTVQRWELREGLPVHRHQHDRLASVYAFPKELDQWLRGRGVTVPPVVLPAVEGGGSSRLERRSATVLVAEIAHFGDLRDRLPPAAVADRQLHLNQALADLAAESHGLIVSGFGSTAIVCFGLNKYAEDPVLVALAARRLIATANDYDLRLSIGIDSGTVLLPLDAPVDASLSGNAVDQARRLASRAGDGEIVAGLSTWRKLAVAFESAAQLIGDRTSNTTVAHVVGERRRDATSAALAAMRSAFVGRRRELAQLALAFRETQRGSGRIVHVTGDPGLGKSRLLMEFRRKLPANSVRILIGSCLPHAAGSYTPLVQALQQGLNFAGDPIKLNEETLRERLVRIDDSLGPLAPQLGHVLGGTSALPDYLSGMELRASLSQAFSAVFSALAHQRPTVLILEDWHWADSGSIEILHALKALADESPLLILVTSRPEQLATDAMPVGVVTLPLAPLSISETAELTRASIGDSNPSAEFLARLHVKTGGNPFFVEEVCDSLADLPRTSEALDGLELPVTVQAVIRARLDRLTTADRLILTTAAVIGRDFSREILEALLKDPFDLGGALQRLTAARILHALRGSTTTFRFKHSLTQEVAYLAMPTFERRQTHARVAQVMVAKHETHSEQLSETLAFHFSRAENWPDAARYGTDAARRAASLSQFARTIELAEQVRSWLSRIAETEATALQLVDLLLTEERAREALGERDGQERIIGEALELLSRHPDQTRLVETWIRLGELRTLQGRYDDARTPLCRASAECPEGDPKLSRRVARALGFCQWRQNDIDDAKTSARQALAFSRQLDDPTGIAYDLTRLAAVHRGCGEHDLALACVEEARAAGSKIATAGSFVFQVWASIYRSIGNNAQARLMLQDAIETQTRSGLPVHRAFSTLALGRLCLSEGEIDAALPLLRDSVDQYRQLRYAQGLLAALPTLADALVRANRPADAASYLEECITIGDRLQEVDSAIDLLERLLWIRVTSGQWAEARETSTRLSAACQLAHQRARVGAILEKASQQMLDCGAPRPEIRAMLERTIALSIADDVLTRARNSLAIIEYGDGRFERARQLYEDALTGPAVCDDAAATGLLLNSLAATLRALGRRHEAIARLERSVAVTHPAEQRQLESHALALLGEIYRDVGDLSTARAHFDRARVIRLETGDAIGEAWMLLRLGELALAGGAAREAEAMVRAAAGKSGADRPARLTNALAELQAQLEIA